MINIKPEERSYEGKQCKITKDQKRVLAEFVTSNFIYRRGLFKLKDETQNKDELWEQITVELNSIGSRKTTMGWRKTCADLRMHVKKKLMEGKELTSDDSQFAQFYGMGVEGNELSAVCYERLSGEQKSRMIDLVSENFIFNTATSKLEPATAESLCWDEIANELNSMGSCVKTTSGWKKCWSDIKCDVAKKFDGQQVPIQLTPGECKIAQLYNFNNFVYQEMSHVKELGMETVDEEAVEEEHLDSLYVEERCSTYLEEMDEGDLTNHSTVNERKDNFMSLDQKPDYSDFAENKGNFIHIQHLEPVQNNHTTELMEKLLEEQKRTNNLLEKLLEQQKASTDTQMEMLNELRNNSFFVMTNPNRNNPMP